VDLFPSSRLFNLQAESVVQSFYFQQTLLLSILAVVEFEGGLFKHHVQSLDLLTQNYQFLFVLCQKGCLSIHILTGFEPILGKLGRNAVYFNLGFTPVVAMGAF
jgi:hypothetical protein